MQVNGESRMDCGWITICSSGAGGSDLWSHPKDRHFHPRVDPKRFWQNVSLAWSRKVAVLGNLSQLAHSRLKYTDLR